MTQIRIPYAKGHISAEIPDNRLLGILVSKAHSHPNEQTLTALNHQGNLVPKQDLPKGSQEELVIKALRNPIGTVHLSELVKGKHKIVIITSDHTRPVPSKLTAPLLVKEIRAANKEAEIIFLVATGFHKTMADNIVGKNAGITVIPDGVSVIVVP